MKNNEGKRMSYNEKGKTKMNESLNEKEGK